MQVKRSVRQSLSSDTDLLNNSLLFKIEAETVYSLQIWYSNEAALYYHAITRAELSRCLFSLIIPVWKVFIKLFTFIYCHCMNQFFGFIVFVFVFSYKSIIVEALMLSFWSGALHGPILNPKVCLLHSEKGNIHVIMFIKNKPCLCIVSYLFQVSAWLAGYSLQSVCPFPWVLAWQLCQTLAVHLWGGLGWQPLWHRFAHPFFSLSKWGETAPSGDGDIQKILWITNFKKC